MTALVAVVSDTHCGGTTGLCPPLYELNGHGHREANDVQKWLWRCWTDYWQRIEAIRKSYEADLWVVLNGDLVEGDHHGTTQVVSLRHDDMMGIAIACLEPHVRQAKHLFVTKGTEAHVGAGSLWDDMIADDLGAERDEGGKSPAWYWLAVEIEGVLMAFSHHGRAGAREYTKGTGARTIAADMTMRYARYKWKLPQVATFGHVHKFEDSGQNYPIHVRTSGCWQLSTSYGHKIRPGLPPDIGGLFYLVQDGEVLNNDPVLQYTPQEPRIWTSQQK